MTTRKLDGTGKNLETMRKKGRGGERFRPIRPLRKNRLIAMLAAQGGVRDMQIRSSPATSVRGMSIMTTRLARCLRAILLPPCNVMLGVAKDSPANLLGLPHA